MTRPGRAGTISSTTVWQTVLDPREDMRVPDHDAHEETASLGLGLAYAFMAGIEGASAVRRRMRQALHELPIAETRPGTDPPAAAGGGEAGGGAVRSAPRREAGMDVACLRRELHDSVGSAMTVAVMRARSAARRLDDEHPASSVVESLVGDLQGVLEEVRRLARAEPARSCAGTSTLLDTLRRQARRVEDASDGGLRVRVCAAPGLGEVAPETALVIQRVTEEALTNTARHARACSATIRLRTGPGNLVVEVLDDGTGIPAGRAESACGAGLRSIRQRVREANGSFEISRCRPRGTRLVFRLPHGDGQR